MSMSLKEFKKSVDAVSITDENEILDICAKMLQLKIKDFISDNSNDNYIYNYVVKNMLDAFRIKTEKYDDVMSFEEFIMLFLIAIEDNVFDSSEDTLFVSDYHPTRCYRDLQVQKLAEAMLLVSSNPVVNRFLRINVISFVDLVWKCKNQIVQNVPTEEIYETISALSKQPVSRTMTLRDAFELSKRVGRRPWLPGAIPLYLYVLNAKKNVHFVSMLLVDCLNKLFEIEKKYDAGELLEKYSDAIDDYEEDDNNE